MLSHMRDWVRYDFIEACSVGVQRRNYDSVSPSLLRRPFCIHFPLFVFLTTSNILAFQILKQFFFSFLLSGAVMCIDTNFWRPYSALILWIGRAFVYRPSGFWLLDKLSLIIAVIAMTWSFRLRTMSSKII